MESKKTDLLLTISFPSEMVFSIKALVTQSILMMAETLTLSQLTLSFHTNNSSIDGPLPNAIIFGELSLETNCPFNNQ